MFCVGNLTGYPAGDLEYLFLEGIGEVLQYGVYFAMILFIAFLIRKMGNSLKYMVAGITAAAGLYYLAVGSVKAECLMSVMFALMLVLVISICGIVTFDFPSLLLMFTTFLFPQRFFNSSFGLFGYGVIYLVIWLVIMSFSGLQNSKGGRSFMAQYVLFIGLSFAAFLYKSIEDINFSAYRFFHIIGRGAFVLFEMGLVFFFAAAAFVLKKKAGVRIQTLMVIDRKYPNMKRWIAGLEMGTMAVIMLLPIPFVLTRTVSDTLQNALAILDILLLIMQMLYIVLIYKITDYRHTAQFADSEKEYYSSLNQNLENIQDLRHDIKNIFLTMSAYVERSTDIEMKDFYRDRICPLIEGEIEHNTIFSKLCQIPSEELRAFLYMKCMQASQRGIAVKLSVQVKQDEFGYGMELVDLTRILGILLDNSIEECENGRDAFIPAGNEPSGCEADIWQMPRGSDTPLQATGHWIEIDIRTQRGRVSYSIKNSIRKGHDFGHMIEQKSDKSGHKGRGLKIIRNILEGYPNITLNTLVDKEIFRQTLNLIL